ncbi:hypothetical protein CEUSTIGMA_g11962.t1 [Chlamydomonas eustigma]|uniref:Elongation factor Tu, chloroplastic n=1 Tax=Chlamydomonas eustigma TaxID=1157962 RepID=A0A250XN79_9CHLO|nr:hypothetical protein CEUSTIGMA_g11962.t1 [Chlamydomonas eustigma]|eukprot:GAX84541.1 hypothetical protein CEUSTIGMA_g11962.t1 [Chlamydomonas eustigma]
MEPVSVTVVGHSRSGKSSLLGAILYALGSVTTAELDRLEREGGEKFAAIWDSNPFEKEQKRTIDVHVKGCSSKHFQWTFIDVPGDRKQVLNMISGIACADCILLVLDATPGVFEANMEDATHSQTKEHLLLTKAFAIKQVIVVVNKMDACHYDQGRFDTIYASIMTQMKRLHLNSEQTRFIPASAVQGQNVRVACADRMPWYTGSTILEAMDSLTSVKRHPFNPLRLPILVSGIGAVVCGKIESGTLHTGQEVVLEPGGKRTIVKSVELFSKTVNAARAGEWVGVRLSGLSIKEARRGHVLHCNMNDRGDNKLHVTRLTAQVSVIKLDGIAPGMCGTLAVHTVHVPVQCSYILSRLDKKTGHVDQKKPESLLDREIGEVEFVSLRPVSLEAHKDFASLGRFVLLDHNHVIAWGVIKSVVEVTNAARSDCLSNSVAYDVSVGSRKERYQGTLNINPNSCQNRMPDVLKD